MKPLAFFAITLVLLLLVSTPGPATAADPDWQKTYEQLLQKYVTAGGVRYREWHAHAGDRKALTRVVETLASIDISKDDKAARLAFYLDAYNAWILHNILEDYPTEGPGGGGIIGRTAFFKSKSIRVGGKKMSFNTLENDIIRKQFADPRIHFALNCASTSCPPLHGRAFSLSHLDQTLDSLTRTFINANPLGVKQDGKGRIAISKIFDWYQDDFLGRGTVLDYLNSYREKPFPKGTKIEHQDYLWTLNEAP